MISTFRAVVEGAGLDRDPIALIADVNLKRRNLTTGQHAMGYAMLYPEPRRRVKAAK